ncbi:MAG: Hpt domain-containing protein, partial [Bacteroidetes bacterium]|nr:Hpt domain-containing protein [Bacteroidota bacterium]
MKFDRSTFIQKYLSETRDNLERINRLLLELEKNPADLPILQDLMRSLHTIKGSSRMLNISSMGDVAHHFEEAVEHVTKREGGLVSSVIDIFLETSDRMVKLLDDVALEQSSPTEDILENLQHIIDGTPKTVATPEPVSPQKGKPVRQAVHIDKTV